MIFEDINQFYHSINNKKVILGIDLGEKKIGIAISNSEQTMSVPLHTIIVSNIENSIKEIEGIVISHNVGAIVIGLPVKLDGTEAITTDRTRIFARTLTDKISLPMPIFLYDERFTSKVANNVLKIGGIKRKLRNNLDDRVAANIILDGALCMLKNLKKTTI